MNKTSLGFALALALLLGCTGEVVGTAPYPGADAPHPPPTADDPDDPPPASDDEPPPAADDPDDPPPITVDAIELALTRLDGGSGSVLVSSGIPLPAGVLTPDETDRVRVIVDGEEQPIHVRALAALHRDGSVRSLLLQLRYDVGDDPVAARLELGTERSTDDLPATEVTWGVPDAVALPTSADYLVSTELVGPTVTVDATPDEPGYFQRYEDNFVRYSDRHHESGTGRPWQDNYYDRTLSHYAYWVRSADPLYFERATRLFWDYLHEYIVANDYRSTPRNMHTEGMELHYLLVGNELSREAVGRLAERMTTPFPNNTTHSYGLGNIDGVEGRIQARMLQLYFTAWRLSVGDWEGHAREAVDMILMTQSPDGAYRFSAWCGYHSYYMTALVNDALIKYYEHLEADPRILDSVGRALDYQWESWNAAEQAFPYLHGSCEGKGGPGVAPDLNMFQTPAYAWYAREIGDDAYLERAELLFAGGVAGAWLDGYKQFNESYYNSFRYLGYR